MIILCQFCGENKKSVKAHIIPEAFFRDISDEGGILKHRQLGTHPKKSPKGVYDDKL